MIRYRTPEDLEFLGFLTLGPTPLRVFTEDEFDELPAAERAVYSQADGPDVVILDEDEGPTFEQLCEAFGVEPFRERPGETIDEALARMTGLQRALFSEWAESYRERSEARAAARRKM